MKESNFITRLINEVNLDPSKLVYDIIARYKSEDFKKVISDISNKTKIPKIRLVQLYCDQTGTETGNLPGGYVISDFLSKTPISKIDKDDEVIPITPDTTF